MIPRSGEHNFGSGEHNFGAKWWRTRVWHDDAPVALTGGWARPGRCRPSAGRGRADRPGRSGGALPPYSPSEEHALGSGAHGEWHTTAAPASRGRHIPEADDRFCQEATCEHIPVRARARTTGHHRPCMGLPGAELQPGAASCTSAPAFHSRVLHHFAPQPARSVDPPRGTRHPIVLPAGSTIPRGAFRGVPKGSEVCVCLLLQDLVQSC
jgi:hypothetical protein